MIGEGGADVITRPTDFKMAPEASGPKNFTPLPDFGKPDFAEQPKYEEPSMTPPDMPDMSNMPPELRKIMEDIKTGAVKDENNVGLDHSQIVPEKAEKPQGLWAQLKQKIQNFFRNLFR